MFNITNFMIKEWRRNSYKELSLLNTIKKIVSESKKYEGKQQEVVCFIESLLEDILFEMMSKGLRNKNTNFEISGIKVITTPLTPFKGIQCQQIAFEYYYEMSNKNHTSGSFIKYYWPKDKFIVEDEKNDIWLLEEPYNSDKSINLTKEVVEPLEKSLEGVQLRVIMD